MTYKEGKRGDDSVTVLRLGETGMHYEGADRHSDTNASHDEETAT